MAQLLAENQSLEAMVERVRREQAKASTRTSRSLAASAAYSDAPAAIELRLAGRRTATWADGGPQAQPSAAPAAVLSENGKEGTASKVRTFSCISVSGSEGNKEGAGCEEDEEAEEVEEDEEVEGQLMRVDSATLGA